MKIVRGSSIDKALEKAVRVYMCGNLQQDEEINFIPTSGLEIALSKYDLFTAEKPHYHSFNHEYNFVIEGEVKVFSISENKVYHLRRHDLFLVEPNQPYVSKAKAGTEVVVVKSPGGNDKVMVEGLSSSVIAWLESWDNHLME